MRGIISYNRINSDAEFGGIAELRAESVEERTDSARERTYSAGFLRVGILRTRTHLANRAAQQTSVILFPFVDLRKCAAQTELFWIACINAGNKWRSKFSNKLAPNLRRTNDAMDSSSVGG